MKSLNFKYLISISIIITFILGSIFCFFYLQIKKMIFHQVYQKASVIADEIIIVRKWVADMRGVFVIQRPGIEPNRFLPYPTLNCNDITLVLRNPALITKELSEMTKNLKSYFFKLTSDKVINPNNAPDKIELKALKLFKEKKIKEYKAVDLRNGKKFFRLIKPLYIKDSCLTCHIYQGYNVGQLRGALSIFIPLDSAIKDLKRIQKIFILAGFLIVFLTTIIVYFVNYLLTIKPIKNLTNSIEMFKDKMDIEFTPSNRKDEIGILEKSFFEMAIKIKNNYEIMQKEIERATEELKKKDKLKTDFIATVSHELRTPLTTIQGGIEYLSKVLKKKENIEFVEIIDKNIKNLILMVNNLIDIARIELGKLELNLKKENLKEIIEEVLIFFKGYAIEKNITFEKKNFFDAFIFVDRRRINQVFINVIHNAIKFSPENEKIVIEMANNIESGNISVSIINRTVEDLRIEDVNKFFIKYKYLTDRKEKGSGLGLAIAKGIMEAHKGDIVVEIIDKKIIKFKIVFSTELEKNESGNKNINC